MALCEDDACVGALQVVMVSILGFGALTKPLLAAMLKDTDAPIMEQLRAIPLLRCGAAQVLAGWCSKHRMPWCCKAFVHGAVVCRSAAQLLQTGIGSQLRLLHAPALLLRAVQQPGT